MMPNEVDVDSAVDLALNGNNTPEWVGMWPIMKKYGLQIEEGEDASYIAHEQASLAEALIRGYAEFVLPQLIERFKVVEVEREDLGVFELPCEDGSEASCGESYRLYWGMRGDALLMERASLDLYILSLKTTKEWGKKSDDSARHDMQGMSECATVEQRLEWWAKLLDLGGLEDVPRWFRERHATGAPPIISGVKMEFALKGRRGESPKGSGRYYYENPLIRPWKKTDDLGRITHPYAFQYEFKDDMGGNHRLGKGWGRINIWEDIGVKEWIKLLKEESLQGFPPGRGIEKMFVLPFEYTRNEDDIESWKLEVLEQEKRVEEGRKELRGAREVGDLKQVERLLSKYFPKHTRSCDWPSACVHQIICFGPKEYLHSPMSSMLYTIRVPNHQQEVECQV